MKKLKRIFSNIKHYNDELFQNIEKITIIDRSKVLIQNYREVLENQDNFIKLTNIMIRGNDLRITTISKYFIEIVGEIKDVSLGAVKDEG